MYLSKPELGLNPLGPSHGHCLVRPSNGTLQVRHLPVFSSEVSPPPSTALSSLLSSLQMGTFFLGNFPPTSKFFHAQKPKGHFAPFNSFGAFVNLSS